MPSMSPFMQNCASSPMSIATLLARVGLCQLIYWSALFLPRQLASAGGILAVLPDHELAVLDHIGGDQGHRVLAVVVKSDLTDDQVLVLHRCKRLDHLVTIRSNPFDGVDDQLDRRVRKRSIRFGRSSSTSGRCTAP